MAILSRLYREAGTLTLPAGWTQIVETRDNGSNAIYLTVAWKRASSEGASYTFTLSTSTWRAGVILAFSGCATSGSPVDTYATDNTTLSVPRLASITTSVADTMRVGYFGDYDSGGLTAGTSGMTESSGNGAVESFYAAQASAGASGTISNFGGFVASGDWASVHLALLPAGGSSQINVSDTAAGSDALAQVAVTLGLADTGSGADARLAAWRRAWHARTRAAAPMCWRRCWRAWV